MQNLKHFFLSATVMLVSAAPATADGTWALGVLGGAEANFYEGGDKTDAGAAPFLSYDTERLHLGFDGISYKFIADPALSVGAKLGWRAGPDFPDDTLFDGLDRDSAVEGGLFARYGFGPASYVGGGFMYDLSSEHGGYEADLYVGTEFAVGSVGVDISLGGKFRDGDLNHYLVGVSADEANGQRAAYAPGSSVIPYVELTAGFALSEKATLVGMISYEYLGSTYKDGTVALTGSADDLMMWP